MAAVPAGQAREARPLARRRVRPADAAFRGLLLLAIGLCLGALAILIVQVASTGAVRVSVDFLTSYTSSIAGNAGFRGAVLGSLWILVLVALVAFPLGVGAALYLEEFAPKNRFTRLIETNIANLAAVPSIVYGMLGLAIFVRALSMGRSVLAAALTLALLVLPIIIVASREALRAVPRSVREGGLALGATRLQTVRSQVMPAAIPGILTGTILAISRAVGEAAPLIVVGAATTVLNDPKPLGSAFTAMPIQIYNWTGKPQKGFEEVAAAGILVLIATVLVMNLAAILLRNKYSRRW